MHRLAPLFALVTYCRPYAGRFVWAFVFLCLAALATLAIPLAFRRLIDAGFGPGADPAAIDSHFRVLAAICVLLAGATAARFYSVSWLGERITADLRLAVYANVLEQDAAFFEGTPTGEILSRLTTDTTLVQTVIGTSLSMGLRNTFLFVGALAMLLVTNTTATLAILAAIALTVLPVVYFGRRVRSLSRDSQDRVADASAIAGEVLGAIALVQAYVNEAFERRRFGAAAERAFASAVRRTAARALLTAAVIAIVFGGAVFGLWLGARAVAAGTLTAGMLAQAVLYVAMVAGSVGALAEVAGDILRAAGAAERLVELARARSAIRAPAQPAPFPAIDPAGTRIGFEDVVFSYPTRPGTRALDGLSLAIEPGETVAVIGPSGAGKSTLMQLLLRYRDPQAGRVRVDGVDLAQCDPASLRARIAIVPQDVVIFAADAMENIRYGAPGADDAAVLAAARAAHADEFIARLPDGYRTHLGERGVRLSGGQRQRIAIARAILKDAPLLLLDEATSALDNESERAVRAAIAAAARGRTTLVVAHRLSTVRDADRIVVLDGGRIVESGPPARLLASDGFYARLTRLSVSDGEA